MDYRKMFGFQVGNEVDLDEDQDEETTIEDLDEKFETLEEEVKRLKSRLFPEEKKRSNNDFFTFDYLYFTDREVRKISLEEKVDAIAKHFGISFEVKECESEVIAKAKSVKTNKKVGRPKKKR